MNKTLKTIAWICLALGLLGTAVDAAALIHGRNLIAGRQAALDEMRTTSKSGENPTTGKFCLAEDANNVGKPDGDCIQAQLPGNTGARQPGFESWTGRNGRFMDNRGGFNDGWMNPRGILPLFFLGLGPVLLIVGAVILLVNREPKPAVDVKTKEVKKDTKTKK